MGIDAEILVRVQGEVNDDNVRAWSYQACAAFGNGSLPLPCPLQRALRTPRRCLPYTRGGAYGA